MYSSLFSALFLVSSVFADSPVNTSNNTLTNNINNAANNTNTITPTSTTDQPAANSTKPIAVNCISTYLAFSERDVAELDPASNTTQADQSKLSDTKEGVICTSPQLSGICNIQSCTGPYPTCSECYSYVPDNNGNFTLGTVPFPSMTCSDNYSFNATNVETPILCANSTMLASCKKQDDLSRSCSECYNANDIPSA